MENMKTDLMAKMVPISDSLPSKKGSTHKMLSSLDWKNSKIHEGFAKAYSPVSDELIEKICSSSCKEREAHLFHRPLVGGLTRHNSQSLCDDKSQHQ